MPLNWQLKPGRFLILFRSWNPSLRRMINLWWWAPSNLPNTKLLFLDTQWWIQEERKKIKMHLRKRETRKSPNRISQDPRRTQRRRRTKEKWSNAPTVVRDIILSVTTGFTTHGGSHIYGLPCPSADSLDPMDHFFTFDFSKIIPKNTHYFVYATFKPFLTYTRGYNP